MDNYADSVETLWETSNTPAGPLAVTAQSPTLLGMTGQDTDQPRKLLRPQEVQKLLGVGRTTLHDYESSGRLTAERTLGGHRRYPADQPALSKLLEAGQ